MNDIVKNRKDILEKALKSIETYMQVKDDVLDNDFVQLLGDSSKIVRFLRGSSELILRKKFESFLKGFSLNEKPTEAQLERLIKYIDDEAKAEFIADTFSKILLSKSSKACLIMGSILNSVVEDSEDLTHAHLISINALMNFYDMDIKNYKFILSLFKEQNNAMDKGKLKNLSLSHILKEIKENKLDKTSVVITLEKSVSHQLLFRDMKVEVDVDPDADFTDTETIEYFSLTSSGILLESYLDRCY
ncbi:hypothetical protein P9D57_01300 [Bacillus sonorensis]|uniref:hypothetical protein n=1 Tax=Bacillus sonorensis TaxID=119858 RepID=UPI002DBB4A78|nr:hypothetical protein [Bacillus sonorensis]MEC1437406.1 hypothetical protein [Bacillus sonorensis]